MNTARKLKTRVILMLEDDADDRHITESSFSANSYNIHLKFLTNGDDVMKYLSSCRAENGQAFPDLIILDKHVPVKDGLTVLKDIKSHPVYKKIPVVMISGTAFPHEVETAYELGVNSFIEKPTNDKLTTEKISSFIKYWFETVELPEIV